MHWQRTALGSCSGDLACQDESWHGRHECLRHMVAHASACCAGTRADARRLQNQWLGAVLVVILVSFPAAAQTKTWNAPKTPDGQPDLQGTWTNATITPLERPDELAAKPVLTPQEAAEIEKRAAENHVDRPPKPGDVG